MPESTVNWLWEHKTLTHTHTCVPPRCFTTVNLRLSNEVDRTSNMLKIYTWFVFREGGYRNIASISRLKQLNKKKDALLWMICKLSTCDWKSFTFLVNVCGWKRCLKCIHRNKYLNAWIISPIIQRKVSQNRGNQQIIYTFMIPVSLSS